MVKDYNSAIVTKLGGVVVGGKYQATVPGITAPVPVTFGLPEEWWMTYALPGVSVVMKDLVFDPTRAIPGGYKLYELSTNPSYPNTYNRQKDPSQPYNFIYDISVAAESQTAMDALLEHVVLRLPSNAFGAYITVYGKNLNLRQMGFSNKSKGSTQDGRKFCYSFLYSVEGWLTSLECDRVKQILTTDITYEIKGTGEVLE